MNAGYDEQSLANIQLNRLQLKLDFLIKLYYANHLFPVYL